MALYIGYALVPVAALLTWRARTRWAGLLLGTALGAYATLICLGGWAFYQGDAAAGATRRAWGIAGAAFALLTLALLVATSSAIRAARQRRSTAART